MDRHGPLLPLLLAALLIAVAVGAWAYLDEDAPAEFAAKPAPSAFEPVLEPETELPSAPGAAATEREALDELVVVIEEPLDPEEDEDFEEITEEPEPLPVPEDPPERGECTLQLYLVDRVTGERVAGTVELWRLDAPANADWSRGDQRQVSLRVEPEGRVVEDLPVAVYRPHVQSAAFGSERAAEFAVQGRWTVHEVKVTRALPVEATLILVDDDEERLERAELEVGRLSSSGVASPPPWRVKRTLTATGDFYHVGGGWGGSGGRWSWRWHDAGPDGFPLKRLRTDTRAKRYTQRVDVRTEGGLRLQLGCSVTEAVAGPLRFVAPYPTRERLLEGVALPGGTPLTEVEGVSVTVRASARPLAPAESAVVAAREVVLEVAVALAGFEPLEFEWRRGEAVRVNREMIPATR